MIFSGKGRIHLNGHKDLTDKAKPIVINDFEYVYIPMMNMNNTNIEILVKEGDYVKVGQLIGQRNDHFNVPIFSSVSGEVVGIEKMMSASLIYAQHVKIKNDMKFDAIEQTSKLDVSSAGRKEIVEAIKAAGITGCGGSGFPTYVKYNSEAIIDTVLINGVECEPYITIDYKMMITYAEDLVLGVKYLLKASNAKKAIIAFKTGKTALKEAVAKALENVSEDITFKEVPDVYPMGWERTLIKELFQKRYKTLPSEIGVIVNNSTTAIKVAQALQGRLQYTTGLTLSGEALNTPTNVIVPTGAKIADIVEKIGGYKSDLTPGTAKLVMGGPMMGKAVVTDEVATNTYTNAVNVLYDEGLEDVACLRCSRCVEYCPAGLQPVQIKDAELAQDVKQLEKLAADTCISCGLCSYICPSRIQVTDYTSKGKNRLLGSKK
ncbi:RnfABCDGE type electron transport complex subunit C [Mycoplasma sp. P36-A1]|uniref:RnfABCDGE type electron transport complex subunit C n=1 Tax=Mycoplasma sp. P36-A1 TaxID=3252900 RepID=UPI003C2D7EE9